MRIKTESMVCFIIGLNEVPHNAKADNKVHGANMGPIWDRQDPGGPHVGSMNFVIWEG